MPSALKGTRILLAAGGTGGHLQPALAVAAEAERRGALIAFVTTPAQREHLPERYQVFTLELKGIARRFAPAAHARALALLTRALPGVARILAEARPRAVVGGGSFVSGPVVAAAALRGIPTLALEADAHLGVANRLLRPFVKRYCLAFPLPGRRPPTYVVTGRPLTDAQVSARAVDGRAAFALTGDHPVLLVFGGSQGAQSLNRACVDAFGGRTLPYEIVHVCGARNYDEVRSALEERGEEFVDYHLVSYTDRLAAAMAAADLVVARAGGSVAELAALGKPAILVPYPYATADHQRKNAAWMAAGGAAVVVDDEILGGELLRRLVDELLAAKERLRAMAAASQRLGRPDAARHVVDQLEQLVEVSS